MKKIVAIIYLLGCYAVGKGQTLIKVKASDTLVNAREINIEVDGLRLENNFSQVSKPGTGVSLKKIAWIEYGNGQFNRLPNTPFQFYPNTKSNCSLMLAKTTGIYENGGRPPRHTARLAEAGWMNTGNTVNMGRQVLPGSGGNVAITPNVYDVVAGDTMFIALTYRKPDNQPAGNYQLVFFYNKNASLVYELLDTKSKRTYSVTSDKGQKLPVPYIRTHNGESAGDKSSLQYALPPEYQQQLNNAQCVVFTMRLEQYDSLEHHIFITLVPDKDLVPNEINDASLDAVLLGRELKPEAYTQSSAISGLGSHDPNWQQVYPQCIVLPKAGQVMKHYIHFQNTGWGPAKKVVLRTSLPAGITANDIVVTDWSIGGIKKNPLYSLSQVAVGTDSVGFEFVYTSATRVLEGALNLPDAPVNVKTMGDVYFTCRAKPTQPDVLKSGTAIYFDQNEAVKTEETKVEFKKCCDCDKKCRKYKRKFWKWLLCKDC